MASPSSSTLLDLQLKTWDAFVSFRGEDVRYGLLSHLSKALEQKQINAFIDDKLCKGEEISQALLEIIEDSYVSVVIFSENYADSPWCLDELVRILECRGISGQVVLPVFYKVDPTDVQELRGSFGKAFHKLKEECQDCLHKVDGWSQALEEISNLSGWDTRNIRYESELVEEIVKGVLMKLSRMPSNDIYNDKLVGIGLHVKKVELLLQIGLVNDNRTIRIWGMGGIGKTTIADVIFSRNMAQFDSFYFVINVREEIKNETPIMLRDKIICQLLRDKGLHINTLQLPDFIKRRLQRKKVIIVFDDVNDPDHLKLECDLFKKGSRIIVTSRDRQVLKNVCSTGYINEVEKLIEQEALQLFCLYAFKRKHPMEGYQKLSQEVIRYAQGNPLALIVLGSNLYDKGMEEWESKLEKLKNIPDIKIHELLKLSYDGLDCNEKNVFLDIECFFKREHVNIVQRLLESYGFFPKIEMSRLVDKSLISISANGIVDMHDLVQQMGKDIVYEECKQLEGHSRLWNSKDISHVLTKDKGTEKVEGILLNMFEIGHMEISSIAFQKMCNLRFFKFCNSPWRPETKLHFSNGLEFLPEELRYLQWDDYPLKYLPIKFCPNNLVELHMPRSQLKQLWKGDEPLANLKVMDLSDSLHLIRIPDLFGALNLEVLKLKNCQSLVEIPSSIQYLRKLNKLEIKGCTSLCSLPSCLHLERLQVLDLSSCSKLKVCLEIPFNIKHLILDGTAIEELPSSIEHCSQLIGLSLRECTRLVSLPICIGQLKFLRRIELSRCSKLSSLPQIICTLKFLEDLDVQDCLNMTGLPDNLEDLESLRYLNIGGSGIKTLPSSINQLGKLEFLFCWKCDDFTMLSLLTGLSCLRKLDLHDCGMFEISESLGSLLLLETLYLDGNNFESIPVSIKQLSNLKVLSLRDCKRLRYLPELPCLEDLYASNCFSLESASTSFASSLDHKSWDRILNFCNCINLDSKIIMDDVLESHLVKQQFISLCVPGVEAPQGMRYQNKNGSSLSNIRLNHHHDDRMIIGFSFCAVFDPELFYTKSNDWFNVECIADFKDEFGYSCSFKLYSSFEDWISSYSDLQHIFLWYSTFHPKEPFTEASFQFFIYRRFKDEYDDKAIMMCGVHPVFEDDCVGKDKKRIRNDDCNEDDQHYLEKTKKKSHMILSI